MGYFDFIERAHVKGTYGAMWPSVNSDAALKEYFKDLPELVDDFHVTVCYSRNPLGDFSIRDNEITINLDSSKFEYAMFGDTLVMLVPNPSLQQIWYACMQMGATWDYPSYQPHITLVKEFKGNFEDLPPTPEFNIALDKLTVSELED